MDARWRCLGRGVPLERDLDIRVQGGQATVQAVKGKARKPPCGKVGNIGLGYAKQIRRFSLFQPAFFEQKVDLVRQLGFGETFFTIGQSFKRMQGFYDPFIVTVQGFCHGVLSPFLTVVRSSQFHFWGLRSLFCFSFGKHGGHTQPHGISPCKLPGTCRPENRPLSPAPKPP